MERLKILVADDESRMRKLVKDFLIKSNFEVLEAEDGSQALDLFYATKDIALIILDVMMPKMDGFEVCREIRQTSQVPIIMLTAKGDERDELQGFQLGVDEYITKPFRPRELLSRIRNVIRHTGILEENRQEIQIEHVKMNLEQGAVYKNNERIELTALEYKILALFFENKGRILTRGQILSGIWDESGNFVNNNTLTVYIKRLREKIEEDPNAPKIIKTVRGMGYKAGV